MANMCSWLFIALFFFSVRLNHHVVGSATAGRKAYIVYMGEKLVTGATVEPIHINLLQQVLEGSCSARESLLYSYGKSFNGFAAMLTDQEQKKLKGMESVVSVFRSKILQLHTSNSWDFLGLPTNVRRLPKVESDVIIGVIDTGIWPESKSFNDDGIGPPPKKWKGTCQNFKCNNKIIGARFYKASHSLTAEEENSPLDMTGHGSHTASTAAGREVMNISLYGLAKGTVRGAVPSARIAVYKVCWTTTGCDEHDLLAAFDDAIADGVDIISVSLGSQTARDYDIDAIAIGSYHAMKKGILTSASAGNSGPITGGVANVAPWLLSVAAINTNRQIISKLTLGNNKSLKGLAVNTFHTDRKFSPLVHGDEASNNGKIVIYNESSGQGPLLTGAQGVVVVNARTDDVAYTYPLPATVLNHGDGERLNSYMSSTRNPVAFIHKSRDVYDSEVYYVPSFSARGYNRITNDILKPDLAAPGVGILAAWSPRGSISGYLEDNRSVKYNIASGTSMACPHATGAAAYVKTFHPNWSPAAIRSALMTTAYQLKGSNGTDDEYAYGSGQIDPVKAVNPGLIYETVEDDYIQMLCVSTSPEKIRSITGGTVTCRGDMKTEAHMNYPSMSAFITKLEPFKRSFPRTLTNVGSPNSEYRVIISPQPLLDITVTPDVLHFKSLYEKQNFTVSISGGVSVTNKVISARILWSDGKHEVNSPIVVWVNDGSDSQH